MQANSTSNHNVSLLFYITTLLILITYTTPQCLTYHEYFDSNTNLCLPCAYNCLTCLDNTQCAVCSDQFYLDNTTNTCVKCPFGCETCSDSVTCVTCNTGMYIDGSGNCISCSMGVSSCSIAVIQQCHDQYFLLGGICAGCLDYCRICEDFVTCTECMVGYYLRSDNQQCLPCSSNCEICTDSATCTSCVKGYTISNSACVVSSCSQFPFCTKCTSSQCLSCEQSKYLSPSGTCLQGASILCEQSTGPYYTDCEVDDYGCPDYAVVQTDPYTYQDISVCVPYSATQYAEYIYGTNYQSNCVSGSCGTTFSQPLIITTRKSFYRVEYNLNIRLYKASSHTINITILNKTTQAPVFTNTHTKSIASQLSTFAQSQTNCSSCPYGQVYLTGSLQSNGYQQTQFSISDQNGAFTIVEYVFKFFTCTIDKCETCTTISDCTLCIQPYLLQLVQCVTECDAGFYKYQRSCVLECPSNTFSIQSSYQCQACNSPCKTCSSETKCLSCVSGYFLQNSTCVLACSSSYLFGNTSSNQCETCPNPCSTCQAVNSTDVKCLSCMVGYLYLQQKCVFDCPIALYNTFQNSISQCATCDSSCSSCYISNTTCAGCSTGYLLYSTYCNQTTFCPDGYFISTDNVCAACQFPCATCITTKTTCTSCLKGALYVGKCVTVCPSGFYTDSTQLSNITCLACTNNCLTCLSVTLCSTCGTGHYLFENQCVTTCPNTTFYANPSNNTCNRCQPPCKQCTSATSCLSCSTGYLDGTICTLACNSSSYINSNFQCTQCPTPCTQCYSASQCIQCQLPSILYSSSCITVSNCSALGKYVAYTKDLTTNTSLYGQCRQCTYPCATCNTSSISCLTCVTTYLYLPDLKTCLQTCPASFYSSSSQCLKCSSQCYECNLTSTNCTSCSSGKYLDTLTSICVSTCPDGYYADNEQGKCQLCVTPCATCYNVYFCKSCITGIFYNKVCVDTCPSGTIFNSTSNQCVFCTNNCLTCNGVTSNCTTCISGYFFNSNNNTCTATCPFTFYPDSFTQSCEKCISPCATCFSSTECITCVSNYFLSNSYCVVSCPNKYYKNSVTMACESCNLTICETCTSTPNNCLTCASGYFFDSAISSGCVLLCSLNYYPQTVSRSCKPCQYPCQQCTNTSYCLQCQSSYKLFQNRCYSSCPIGYFSTPQSTCQQCATNCQICSSSTNCTKCTTLYYVENGMCVTDCSQGLYKGRQDMTNYDYCLTCDGNCEICEDFNTCLKCLSGFYLFNGLCLTQCPILHYTDTSTLSCLSCPTNCVSCLNSTYCLKCINSYMYNNQCYIICPSKTYIFNQQQCQPCVAPCDQCQSQFTCTTCLSPYFYYHAYCVTSCPEGVWYYPHNNSCAQNCPYNKYEEKLVCYVTGCGGKMVEMQGYCLDNCPTGYYVSQQESCTKCEDSPDICKNLFIADLQILRSQQLTLVLYFSQQAELLQSITDVNITFADQNNQITNLTLSSYDFTSYSLTFKFNYQQISYLTAYLTIPYLDSQTTQQAISQSSYSSKIYYFNNYESDKESTAYGMAGLIPQLMTVGLFIMIVVNVIAKTSHFLQLLDMMQLIAGCLYLDIQYPMFLERFLNKLGYVLFTFMPKLVKSTPYTFSSPKYIFYHTDTSFARTHMMTFILFLVLLIAMAVIVLINKRSGHLPSVTSRIKYRNLNDLFSVLSFPLMMFSFSFINVKAMDVVLGLVVILVTLGWIVFISKLIISAEEMGQLKGLLSDYQAVSSKLGLMYSPFSYIRRFISALVFCVFPQRPLAALTLLLIFTILILICLFFYQPFESQITDYVSMYLEFTLILFIMMIVILGLDVMEEDGNRAVGMGCLVVVSLAMVVGLGWLIYLTVGSVKKWYQSWGKTQEVDTEDCIKGQAKNQQSEDQNGKKHQFYHREGENEDSATNLVNTVGNKRSYLMDDMESNAHSNSNKEEFKHWNDEDSESGSENQQKIQDKRAPELLMKKVLKEKNIDVTQANQQIG